MTSAVESKQMAARAFFFALSELAERKHRPLLRIGSV
jgi:hypothetical protein